MKQLYLVKIPILLGLYLCNVSCSYNPHKNKGVFTFYNSKGIERKIMIKSVETSEWRQQQDFIYQTIMPDSCGMLYMFDQEAVQPLRLQKDHQPFDAIFIAPNNRIIAIRKYIPSSYWQIHPSDNAVIYDYALLVNGGFCDKYSINKDDSISFKLTGAK